MRNSASRQPRPSSSIAQDRGVERRPAAGGLDVAVQVAGARHRDTLRPPHGSNTNKILISLCPADGGRSPFSTAMRDAGGTECLPTKSGYEEAGSSLKRRNGVADAADANGPVHPG